ncbi:hypothetical protein GLOIN_2v1596932 [Rhizophagus clarus]|uniref:Uncharacterized protein n=1 Tax=Rhizophagus clarus TaxID=94130 RepID=A0A8H3LPZ9_9GLOM|nr:hypothetical protein GLOIN_2v1596932 [Rhizophagus clarus]
MSKSLPTISVNTDVNIDNAVNTLSSPTSSNTRHIAASSGKKKRAVRNITAKIPRFQRQLNVKSISDSGGSSADEHDITPQNNKMNQIPTIYLSSAESSSTPSTPRHHYSLLNNNNASMPDLSKKLSIQNNSNNHNSFSRLRKLQPKINLITPPSNNINTNNNNNDGYFGEDCMIFQSPVSMPVVNKFKFPSPRTSTIKSQTNTTFASPPTNTKHSKLLKKKKQKSFNIKSPSFRNIMNFDNVATFYSPSRNNKSNLLQSIPYDQITSMIQHSRPPSLSHTDSERRLSAQMKLGSVPKFFDLPIIFIFNNLTEKNEIENFLIFKIKDFTLYYHIVDDNNNSKEHIWCIEHFKKFSDNDGNLTLVGIDGFVEEENFGGKEMMNQKYKAFKDCVSDRFKDVEYKNLCSIDDIHLITENDIGKHMNIFKIQARQEYFILGTYFSEEKRNFLNTVRFFSDTKKSPAQSSDSESDEDEEIDSEDEDICPTDFIELIKELANRCSHYENKIDILRETLIQKAKELDSNIHKCRDLDRRAKDLDENILMTKSRSTKEMEETINLADQTTQGIADKLTSIHTRIHEKSEKLKHHQEILKKLKSQVEFEKKSSKILAQCRMILGVLLVIFIIIIFIFMITSGVQQQLLYSSL